MTCPKCGKDADCINSRPYADRRMRRYRCLNEHRFNTVEVVAPAGRERVELTFGSTVRGGHPAVRVSRMADQEKA